MEKESQPALRLVDSVKNSATNSAKTTAKNLNANGKKPLPQRLVYTEEARLKRIESLEQQQNCRLDHLEEMRLSPKNLRGNIEALIGAVEVPVGVAGPLLIHGSNFSEELFAPIATTEGALVSSLNRGCRALGMSGGVTTRVLKQRMVRAPLFDCGRLVDCLKLQSWIQSRWGEIQRRVREYSNHAVLLEIDFRIISPCLHARFVYETGDASGQNMTTLCTWNICQWILCEFGSENPGLVRHFVIDGNLSTDKKASHISANLGRGREVVAEALIPGSVMRRVFGTTAADIVRYFKQSHSTGILTGIHGLNVNVANTIAGIFTATGQDIACVHESSLAQVYFEERENEGLYISLLLPSLVIGTVGGGVSLAAQKQLLEMMGAYGPGKANRFAEIIASFALALELSTGAALTSGRFADAHERLGRNRQTWWLKKSDLDTAFFNHVLKNKDDSVVAVNEITDNHFGESLVMNLTSKISKRPCGLWAYELQFASDDAAKKVFLKSKVPDEELLLAQEIMAGLKSPGLGELLRENRDDSIFKNSHLREIKLAELDDSDLRSISPRVLGHLVNESRHTYILIEEYLEGLILFDAVEKRDQWAPSYIERAIKDISRVHARHLNRTEFFERESWMMKLTVDRVKRLQDPHFELALQLHRDNLEWFSEDDLAFHERHLCELSDRWLEVEQLPRTLIHNDFNPRNIAFRRNMQGQTALVAYDWELATIHVPQRDVAELLSFTLPNHAAKEDVLSYIELHRKQVEELSGKTLAREDWLRGYELALLDVILQRFPIYSIAQTLRQVPFLEPSYKMARQLYNFVREAMA